MRPVKVTKSSQPERARPALPLLDADLYVPGLIEGAFVHGGNATDGKLGARAAVR